MKYTPSEPERDDMLGKLYNIPHLTGSAEHMEVQSPVYTYFSIYRRYFLQ